MAHRDEINYLAGLLDEYQDWQASLNYPDNSAQAFLEERERARLARNAEAVLLFIADLREELAAVNSGTPVAAVNTVEYLLNAVVGDPEVEEWFEPEAEEVTVTTQTLAGDVINEVTNKGKAPLQSYNSEEGYYEDEEPR